MKSGASTEIRRKAAIYRQAAKRMESRHPGLEYDYSCTAIGAVGGDGEMQDDYVAVFVPEPENYSSCAADTRLQYAFIDCGEAQHDVRILALCFMAAMVEAGDA